MDYYPASLPLPSVPGYMCQPSPTQTPAAVPPNIAFPTIVPAHDIAMIKQPPCTLISNAYAGGPMTVLHLPASLLQTLQRAPFQYDPTKDLVATCSQCGQKNTLWELRMKELIQCLKEEYALKCFLRKEIRFEPFPGEELQISVPGNVGYTQTDLCKISNLRANANEFTPAQRNSKAEIPTTNKYENHIADECEVQQGRLGVIECGGTSGMESNLQDSVVSDSANRNSTTMDSISEKRLQNDSVASAHGSTESLLKKSNEVDDNIPEFHVSKAKLMDSNRNYKYNDETAALTKKDKTNDRYNQMPLDSDQLQQMNKIPVPGRPRSRGSDYKKGSTNGNERRHNGYAEDKRLPSRGSQGHMHSKTKTYDRSKRPNEFNDHGNDIHNAREQKYPFISRHSSNGNHVKKLVPRKTYDTSSVIHEIEGDLFSADDDCSFAHCVSEDFRMGSGIASQFKKQFNGVGDLLNQQKTVGQIAYLERGGRFIFYLITKRLSYMKATLEVMQRALRNLRRLCEELKVKKLAIPLLGCGNERLRWDDVKKLLNEEFFKTNTEIFVYHCREEEMVAANVESSPVSKSKSLKIFEVTYPLKDIDVDTAMVVYGCSDGTVEKVNEQLNAKYPYLEEFAKHCQAGGSTDDFHAICTNREFVCVLIVRNNLSEGLSYTRLENSIRKLNKFLKENSYRYVGIDRINDNNDTLINDKIMSVFRSSLITTVNLYVCSSPPKKSEYLSSLSKSSSYYNTNSTVSSN